MIVTKVRNHIEIVTNQGIEMRIEECKDGIHVVCVTGNVETRKTHGNGINLISDESRAF